MSVCVCVCLRVRIHSCFTSEFKMPVQTPLNRCWWSGDEWRVGGTDTQYWSKHSVCFVCRPMQCPLSTLLGLSSLLSAYFFLSI